MAKGKEIIAINLDTSSDNSSSDSDNNTSDSSSTSQISTSEEIDYDSPDYRGPPKSLLKWYGYLSDEYKDKGGNESDAKPSFSDISKAKACMLAKAQAYDASSKAKVQACGYHQLWLVQKKRKGRERLAGEADFTFLKVIVLSLDNSDDKKGSSKENKENTNKDITDKDITDEDCIHESNYAMSKGKYVPVSKKHNPKFKSSVLVKGCMLGLSNVTKCDEIVNKIGARKSKICEDKAKGKRKFVMLALFRNQAFTSKHLQAFAAFTASKHLQASICSLHLQASICRQAFA
ncbi:hypothetical protein Tco_0676574, partial [Tanacetum coccineum]